MKEGRRMDFNTYDVRIDAILIDAILSRRRAAFRDTWVPAGPELHGAPDAPGVDGMDAGRRCDV